MSKQNLWTFQDLESFYKEIHSFSSPWTFLYQEGNIQMYSKPGTVTTRFKYCGKVPFSAQFMWFTMRDFEDRKYWDPRHLGYEVVEIIKKPNYPVNIIESLLKKSPWPVTDRDFVNLTAGRIFKNEKGKQVYMLLSKAGENDKCPPKDDFVRARAIIFGVVIEEVNENECMYWIETEIDPSGWIPNWVTNWATRLLPAEFESNICKGIQLKIEMGKKFEIFKDALFE